LCDKTRSNDGKAQSKGKIRVKGGERTTKRDGHRGNEKAQMRRGWQPYLGKAKKRGDFCERNGDVKKKISGNATGTEGEELEKKVIKRGTTDLRQGPHGAGSERGAGRKDSDNRLSRMDNAKWKCPEKTGWGTGKFFTGRHDSLQIAANAKQNHLKSD